MERKELSTERGNIVYWASREFVPARDTMFLMHGLTADHTMFHEQISYFAKDYNLLAWDAPGHGESRPYGGFGFASAAHAIREILDRHGVGKAILVGQSLGGYFAQSFIYCYPERAKAFVSIDSTPFGDYYSRSDMWWLRQVEWMAMLFPKDLLKKSMAWNASLTENGRNNMKEMLKGYGKKELCHLMGIGYAGFLKENMPMDIPCPVLLICGAHDATGKVKAYNKEWAKRTGYPLAWIPSAGHNSNVDNPAMVNQAIQRFLASPTNFPAE